MKDNWSNKEFAEDWDAMVSQGNPTRPEQLDILTTVVADYYQPGKFILDIGCGSGQVEELIFKKQPVAKIVGVDSAEPMLAMAQKRLAGYKDNFQIVQKDITKLELADLPKAEYQIVISVQALHELNPDLRKDLFQKVGQLLPVGGMFLIMDRIKADFQNLAKPYESAWHRLEDMAEWKSAKDFPGYLERISTKEDSPGSLDEYNRLYADSGFKSAILHLNFDRAVLVGVKFK